VAVAKRRKDASARLQRLAVARRVCAVLVVLEHNYHGEWLAEVVVAAADWHCLLLETRTPSLSSLDFCLI